MIKRIAYILRCVAYFIIFLTLCIPTLLLLLFGGIVWILTGESKTDYVFDFHEYLACLLN